MTAAAIATALLTPFGPRTWGGVPGHGEDLVAALRWFAMDEELDAASVTGVGCLDRLVVADSTDTSAEPVRVDCPVEGVSLAGTIAPDSPGRPGVLLAVVAPRDHDRVVCGLLVEAFAGPVLELVVQERSARRCRPVDDRNGIRLPARQPGQRPRSHANGR